MKKTEYPAIAELRKKFGHKKEIPEQFEEVVLQALSHFPELKEVAISFRSSSGHPLPYGTDPVFSGIFRSGHKRKYVVTLLDEADLPERPALFKNLPHEAQRGVIGHELGHVIQQMRKSGLSILKKRLKHGGIASRREMEREADLIAIQHGLGFDLYVHATFIRKIPGYVQHRKEIETDFLKPQQILDTLTEGHGAV
jgi:hypothetical protein